MMLVFLFFLATFDCDDLRCTYQKLNNEEWKSICARKILRICGGLSRYISLFSYLLACPFACSRALIRQSHKEQGILYGLYDLESIL